LSLLYLPGVDHESALVSSKTTVLAGKVPVGKVPVIKVPAPKDRDVQEKQTYRSLRADNNRDQDTSKSVSFQSVGISYWSTSSDEDVQLQYMKLKKSQKSSVVVVDDATRRARLKAMLSSSQSTTSSPQNLDIIANVPQGINNQADGQRIYYIISCFV